MNPPVNGKIQGLVNAYEFFFQYFSFNFQGLFKTVLYIQVLFKLVQTLEMSRFFCFTKLKKKSQNFLSAAVMLGPFYGLTNHTGSSGVFRPDPWTSQKGIDVRLTLSE